MTCYKEGFVSFINKKKRTLLPQGIRRVNGAPERHQGFKNTKLFRSKKKATCLSCLGAPLASTQHPAHKHPAPSTLTVSAASLF